MNKKNKRTLSVHILILMISLISIIGILSFMFSSGLLVQQSTLGSVDRTDTVIVNVDSEGITFNHAYTNALSGEIETYPINEDHFITGHIASFPYSTSSLPQTTDKVDLQINKPFPAEGVITGATIYTGYQSGHQSQSSVDINIIGTCQVIKEYQYNQKWTYETECDFVGKAPACTAEGCAVSVRGSNGEMEFKALENNIQCSYLNSETKCDDNKIYYTCDVNNQWINNGNVNEMCGYTSSGSGGDNIPSPGIEEPLFKLSYILYIIIFGLFLLTIYSTVKIIKISRKH